MTINIYGWQQVAIAPSNPSSFNAHLYRKPIIGTNKYDYTFAYRGSQEIMDFIVNAPQVVLNNSGLQAELAISWTKQIIDANANNISKIYFTTLFFRWLFGTMGSY